MTLQIKKCCNKPSPGWPLEGFEVRRGQIGGYDLLLYPKSFRFVEKQNHGFNAKSAKSMFQKL